MYYNNMKTTYLILITCYEMVNITPRDGEVFRWSLPSMNVMNRRAYIKYFPVKLEHQLSGL